MFITGQHHDPDAHQATFSWTTSLRLLAPKQAWSETCLAQFVLGLDSPLGEFTSEAKCLWGECEGNLLSAAEGAWNRPLKKFRPKTGVTTLVLGLEFPHKFSLKL